MDHPELASLNQIEVGLPIDGKPDKFVARDRSSGKVLLIVAELANAVRRLQSGLYARGGGDKETLQRDLKRAGLVQSAVQLLRNGERVQRKAFNPLMMQVRLFPIGPWQHALSSLAQHAVSFGLLWFVAALSALALFLGVQNDWAILRSFDDVFSLEALLTFGLIAPFLKIIHELGHTLAATRFGVRVGDAGLIFIGLFPIPFVDCSNADLEATRAQRIAISAAGVIVDVMMGLMVFVLWHFVGGTYLQDLLGHAFVFLTINSLVFNANPLIRLDGYYVFCDLIRWRNLSTDAALTFRQGQIWLGSLGRSGALPGSPRALFALTYGVLSFFYRIYIVIFIALSVLPKFLGLGVFLAAWGLYALFFAPVLGRLFEGKEQMSKDTKPLWAFRLGALALIGLVIGFVKVPVWQVLPMTLHASGSYAITAPEEGFLRNAAPFGPITQEALLAQIDTQQLEEERIVVQSELAVARAEFDAGQGAAPALQQQAQEKIDSLTAQAARLGERIAAAQMTAKASGAFVPSPDLTRGAYIAPGTLLGHLYPNEGQSEISGPFPESYARAFEQGLREITLRSGETYVEIDPSAARLAEIVALDARLGQRSFQLELTAPEAPAALYETPLFARVAFAPEPIWKRLRFGLDRLIQRYRDAQLAEITGQFDG